MSAASPAFAPFFDAQPFVSLALDAHGTVLAVTDTLLALTGTRRADVVGQPLSAGLRGPLGASWAQGLPRVLAGEEAALPSVFFPSPPELPSAALLPWWQPQLTPVAAEGQAVAYVLCSAQQILAPAASSPLVSPLAPKLAALQFVLDQVPAYLLALTEPNHVPAYVSPHMRQLLDERPVLGQPLAESMPELIDPGLIHLIEEVYRTGEALVLTDFPVSGIETPTLHNSRRYFDLGFHPLRGPEQAVSGVLIFALETTERVHSRQRLAQLSDEVRQQQARFQAMTEALPQITSSADPSGRNVYSSPQWFDYTGLNPEDDVDERWAETMHPDDRARVQEAFFGALAKGEPWELEYRLRRHDGEYRWHHTRTIPSFDAKGNVTAWHGSTVDVHDQREIRRLLEEKDEMLQRILHNIPAIVNTMEGPEHRFTFLSAQFEEATHGRVRLGQSLAEALPEVATPSLLAVLDQVYLTGEPYLAREQLIKLLDPASGQLEEQYFNFAYQLLPALAGRPDTRGILLFAVDVTEQVLSRQRAEQMQEQVRRHDERLRVMAEALPMVTFIVGADGRFEYVSPQWYAYTGYPPNTNVNDVWLDTLYPDDQAAMDQAIGASLIQGQPWSFEMRLRRLDGQYRWHLSRGVPQRNLAGQVVRWFGSNNDIHELKNLQDELLHSEERLRDQNLTLTRTNQDLDNFVYAASHDLKQPVSNLSGLFEELKLTATFHDPEQARLLDMLDAALSQLSATINDLAAVVQVERQPSAEAAEPLDLSTLTAEVLQTLRPYLHATQGEVHPDYRALPALPYVRANLRTVLFNLLSNALKYRHPERPLYVRISSYSSPEGPVLEVQDNGLGLDLERYGHELFQLFRRFHPHIEGSGVGLYLVNRLVRGHGGHIEVESQEGQGTTFRVWLGRV